MARIDELRCLLISPSDVSAERKALRDVVTTWNAQIGRALNARVELVGWETHSVPDLANPPQDTLNEQLLPDCDLAIALFWSRIGTPTAAGFQSGSDEEIRRLLKSGTRILVYFCRRPIPQENLGSDQFERLQLLRSELEALGLVGYYEDVAELREKIQLNLTNATSGILTAQRTANASTGPAEGVMTASRPDVRVSSAVGFTLSYEGVDRTLLSLSVENHSPVPVFIASVLVEMDDGRNLYPQFDAATHEPNSKRRLEPGQSFSFYIDLARIGGAAEPSQLRRALVKDEIGRSYVSDEETFRSHVSAIVGNS